MAKGDMHGRGDVCDEGGMHGKRGACMVKEACMARGTCVAKGACMVKEDVWQIGGGYMAGEIATAAVGERLNERQ